MIKIGAFEELLANAVTSTKLEAKRLRQSKILLEMIHSTSGCVLTDGVLSIREFVLHHFVDEGTGLPLQDDCWDLLLFFLVELRGSSERSDAQACRCSGPLESRA